MNRAVTSVYFESPHRILKSIAVMAEIAPERELCLARELTKKFETFHRGTAAGLAAEFADRTVKGEITLLISGKGGRTQKPSPESA